MSREMTHVDLGDLMKSRLARIITMIANEQALYDRMESVHSDSPLQKIDFILEMQQRLNVLRSELHEIGQLAYAATEDLWTLHNELIAEHKAQQMERAE